VYNYVLDIRAGKVIGDDGQYVQVSESTRFYCYIVADPTPQLKSLAMFHRFHETPDGLGYLMYSPNVNAYFEIIGYRKILEDAR
jgi:hypothetical protein